MFSFSLLWLLLREMREAIVKNSGTFRQ